MGAKASRGPVGFPEKRTYRAQSTALTRGYGVMQGTADDQCLLGTAAARVLGVVEEDVAAAGDLATVIVDGECAAIVGLAGCAAGNAMKLDAYGKFIVSAAEDVETAGYARTTATTDGDEFILDVGPEHKHSA